MELPASKRSRESFSAVRGRNVRQVPGGCVALPRKFTVLERHLCANPALPFTPHLTAAEPRAGRYDLIAQILGVGRAMENTKAHPWCKYSESPSSLAGDVYTSCANKAHEQPWQDTGTWHHQASDVGTGDLLVATGCARIP